MGYYLNWEFLGYITPYNATGYASVSCNPNTGAVTYSGSASLPETATSGSLYKTSQGQPVELVAAPNRWESYIATVVYAPDPIYPYYTLGTPGSHGIDLNISIGDQGYYHYRVFCRLSSETAGVFDEWFTSTRDFTASVTGLQPDTNYVVNVGYNTTGSGDVTWCGARSFRTGTGTQTYIYHNNHWVAATPYIYHNGSWEPATPNIYSGGWQ